MIKGITRTGQALTGIVAAAAETGEGAVHIAKNTVGVVNSGLNTATIAVDQTGRLIGSTGDLANQTLQTSTNIVSKTGVLTGEGVNAATSAMKILDKTLINTGETSNILHQALNSSIDGSKDARSAIGRMTTNSIEAVSKISEGPIHLVTNLTSSLFNFLAYPFIVVNRTLKLRLAQSEKKYNDALRAIENGDPTESDKIAKLRKEIIDLKAASNAATVLENEQKKAAIVVEEIIDGKPVNEKVDPKIATDIHNNEAVFEQVAGGRRPRRRTRRRKRKMNKKKRRTNKKRIRRKSLRN